VTEDEAKTKACCGPFREAIPYAGAAEHEEIARDGLDPEYAAEISGRYPCIASSCMAWRWSGTASQYSRIADVPGFCGLAGPPQ
jgi:hypothetical protein